MVSSPGDPNPSSKCQNTVSLEIQAPNHPTSHVGNDDVGLGSFPIVAPENMHTKTITFEDQLQDIDMDLHKYDSDFHTTSLANPDFQGDLSHRESSIAKVICVGDKCAPLNHVDTHVPITNPHDHDGNQPGLRIGNVWHV